MAIRSELIDVAVLLLQEAKSMPQWTVTYGSGEVAAPLNTAPPYLTDDTNWSLTGEAASADPIPSKAGKRTRRIKTNPKRKLSAAGRAAIRKAVKARWAKYHAAKRTKKAAKKA